MGLVKVNFGIYVDDHGSSQVQANMVQAIKDRNSIAREVAQIKLFTAAYDTNDPIAARFMAAKREMALLDVELEVETKRQRLFEMRRASTTLDQLPEIDAEAGDGLTQRDDDTDDEGAAATIIGTEEETVV